MRGASALRALSALVALLALAWPAAAHLRFPERKGERWVEVDLAHDPPILGYRVGFGADLSPQVRRRADQNHDGVVSALEGNQALDAATAELLGALRVCLGETLEAATCQALRPTDVLGVEAQGWVPGSDGHLHQQWRLRLPRGATEGALRLEDTHAVAGPEITDVTLVPPAGVTPLRAGPGERATGVITRFTWVESQRPPGPRVVVVVLPAAARPRWLWWVVGGVCLLAAAGLWVRRGAGAWQAGARS